MDQPPALPSTRNQSPFQPLILWLGPLFALTNASLYPVLSAAALVFLSMRFNLAQPRGGPPPPLTGFNWLPVLLVLGLALVSLIPVQVLLLSLCLTWSSGVWWRRLAKYWLAVLAAVGAGLAGVPLFWLLVAVQAWATNDPEIPGIYGRHVDFEVGFTWAVVCALPMILLGVQVPFWAIRLLTGCRLQRNDSPALEPTSEALSIKDLFVATALVAVSLTLLQFADGLLAYEMSQPTSIFLFAMLMVTAVSLAVSLLTAVPLVLLFFSRYSLSVCWAATLFATGVCAVTIFAIVQSSWLSGGPQQFLVTCVLAYGYACGSAAGLTLLRRTGWRLRGRNG